MDNMASAPLSWKLPRLGGVADEPLPGWLVEQMVSGRLTVNRLGGFTDEVTGQQCFAEDVVYQGDGGTVLFEVQALAA
jgi:hypothetical protein